MAAAIKTWLNGSRNYGEGVALYCLYGEDMALEALLLKGATDFTKKRLADALTKIYNSHHPDAKQAVDAVSTTGPSIVKEPNAASKQDERPVEVNLALLQATDDAAKKSWKELMNQRAVLFAMCRQPQDWEDENEPVKAKERGKIALDILRHNKRTVLPAFEALACVRATGKLPTQEKQVVTAYDLLPDEQVKHTIDNIRKNISKLKTKTETPRRVALIQEHQHNLDKLLQRWEVLKNGAV